MAKIPFISGNDKRFPTCLIRRFGIFSIFAILTIGSVFGQQTEISGKILEQSSKITVIGATIRLKGQKGGTVSDANGDFHIDVKSLPATLFVSAIGYKNQEIDVYESEPITIYLPEGDNKLNEVVITGLASGLKRSDLANAFRVMN
jgi:hypothetical protein